MHTPRSIESVPVAWILLPLLAVSLAVFTFNNTHEQLWYGEAVCMHATDLPFAEMLRTVSGSGAETNPPLYYIALKCVKLLFGDSLPVARGLSGFLGTLLVAAFFLFVRRLFSQSVALTGSLLLVFNPVVLHFSQDIGAYMLAALLLCIGQFSLLIAIREDKRSFWFLHAAASIAGVYTHHFLILAIAADFVFFTVAAGRPKKWSGWRGKPAASFAASQLAILLFVLPAVCRLPAHIALMPAIQGMERPGLDIPLRILSYFFTTKFSLDINPIVPYQLLTVGTIFFVFLSLQHRATSGHFDDTILFLLTLVIVPFAIVLLYSSFGSSIINFKYFIPYFPFLTAITASGIVLIGKNRLAVPVLILFITANAPTVYGIYTTDFNGPARETAQYVNSINDKGDPVVTFDNASFLTLFYYLQSPSNLYQYSDGKDAPLPGAGPASGRRLNNEQLGGILNGRTGFLMILTPETKEYPLHHLQNILTDFTADSSFEKKFLYPNSWFRIKVVRYARKEETAP
jgi:hypothetical protein